MSTNSPEIKKCPYCAEEIKASAIVCRYCNRPMPGYEGKVVPPVGAVENQIVDQRKQTPPVTIDDVHFDLGAPSEVENRRKFYPFVFVNETWVGRGFSMSFTLVDAAGHSTASDGELVIALVPDQHDDWHGGWKTPIFSPDNSGLSRAQNKAVFHKRISVTVQRSFAARLRR